MEFSTYYYTLDNIHQQRYVEKVALIQIDPYLLKEKDCSIDLADFPKIFYPDIVMYLVHTKSAFTMEEMKAYKSLEAYNQALCGWVKKIFVKQVASKVVVVGKVGFVLLTISENCFFKYVLLI